MGRSSGGISTKIHTTTNSFGLPIRFILSPGQQHDSTEAENLVNGFKASYLLADKAYDKNSFLEKVKNEVKAEPVVPPKLNRKVQRVYDKITYKDRNMIERLFCRFKNYRRIATRYEKTAKNFLAMIQIAPICLWIK